MQEKQQQLYTIDHKLQWCLSGGLQNPHTFSIARCQIFTPALVHDVIMQVSHLGLTAP